MSPCRIPLGRLSFPCMIPINPLNTIIALLIAALPFTAVAQTADNSPSAPEKLDELKPNQRAFLNLPEEERIKFVKHIREADRLFKQQRVLETLEQLHEAQKVFTDSPEIYNLRGSCYVEMRAFDKALQEFNKALDLSPKNQSITFNLGEVYFVTGQWQKAIDTFNAVLEMIPEGNISMSRLVEFKILLCNLKLDKNEEAKAMAEKYDYLDDSPYHYYAKATMAYENGKATEAEQWLARANRIFRHAAIIAPWRDTLIEYGYIKSLYGNDAEMIQP